MKVLISTMPFTGHVNPMQPIAQRLVQQGHEVLWMTGSKLESKVTITGARFISTRASAHYDTVPLAPDEGTSGLAAVVSTLRKLFIDRIPGVVGDCRDILKDFKADILLIDMASHSAHTLRDLEGPPFATLGINPLVTLDPEVPPWGTGWAPPQTIFGRWVNQLMHAIGGWMLYPRLTTLLNAERQKLDLLPLPSTGFFDASRSQTLHIMPTTMAFEFPRENMPSYVKFVGPLMPVVGEDDFQAPDWWDQMLSHPRDKVVHITQGTYATNAGHLMKPALAALADMPDLLVIATTPDVGAVPASDVPSNARVSEQIPHARLLPHVGVMITNAGYNGVLAALQHGVPLVCAGRTEDKADVSSRVAWCGAGIDLGTDTPTEEAIRGAVTRIVGEEGYRRDARRVQKDFEGHDGPAEVCELLEGVVAGGLDGLQAPSG